MNGKIMSLQDIARIEEDILNYQASMRDAVDTITDGISVFNKSEIVQSFYQSGALGTKIEEELLKIKSALEEYYSVINSSGGLIDTTTKVLDAQRNNLNNVGGGI